jgi:hypothetical protein
MLPVLNIGAVERETGLSKDLLRMWERRYGFPQPDRDSQGERQYGAAEVAKLRQVKRLMDAGLRPGKLVTQGLDELDRMVALRAPQPLDAGPTLAADLVAAARVMDVRALRAHFSAVALAHGLRALVDGVVDAHHRIAAASARGELAPVVVASFDHAAAQALGSVIQGLAQAVRPARATRAVLGTLAGDAHGFVLAVAEAVWTIGGAHCLSVGLEAAPAGFGAAGAACSADVACVAVSERFPVRQLAGALEAVRRQLPDGTPVWVFDGGGRRRVPQGVRCLASVEELARAVAQHPLSAAMHYNPQPLLRTVI